MLRAFTFRFRCSGYQMRSPGIPGIPATPQDNPVHVDMQERYETIVSDSFELARFYLDQRVQYDPGHMIIDYTEIPVQAVITVQHK